ncbi:MAG: prohibitin family protein [Rubrobacteridae bacterium]|nr:prohibitin family protein [Rubrobacteridae bacterium]
MDEKPIEVRPLSGKTGGNNKGDGGKTTSRILKIVLTVIIGLFLLSNLPFGIVPAGYRGIVLQLGAVTTDIKQEGFYFKIPFIQKVELMEVRVRKTEAEATAASRDLQSVHSKIALNYHLDSTKVGKLYQNVGPEFEQRIIEPAVQEAFKIATSRYTAEQLITHREDAKDAASQALRTRLGKEGIIIDDLNLVNFQFSELFDQAIEAKVTAEQEALAAKNQLEKVKYQAQQRIEEAKGKAEAIRVEAAALRDNPGVLQLRAVEKWNGTLPQVTGGSIPLVNIK